MSGEHLFQQHSMRNTVIVVALMAIGMALALALRAGGAVSALGAETYLPLHLLLETIAIVVSMLVFAVSWHAHDRKLPGNIVVLSCAFFGVALLDFGHMLSYAGMPDFVTPSNPEKAINFWLAERALAAAALLAAVTMRPHPFASAATRYALFAAALGTAAIIYWLILFHQDELPRTFIPGQGLTPLKIAAEYAIIALNLAAALLLIRQRHRPQPFLNTAALFGAACTMALGEFFFSLYVSVTDIFNLLGHVYVVIAYLFVFRAIFVTAMEAPYRQLQLSESKLRGTLDAIPDLVWLKDANGVYLECNAQIERLLGRTKAEILGKTDYDILDRERADFFREQDRAVIAEGRPGIAEVRLTFPEGREGFFETIKTPVHDAAGKLIGVLGISRDITERKTSEAKIRRLSQMHRLLSRVNESIVRSENRSQLFAAISSASTESGLFRFTWIGMRDETRVVPVAHAGDDEGHLPGKSDISLDDERTANGPTGRAIREGRHVVCQDISGDPCMAPWRDEAAKRGFRSSASFPIGEAGGTVGAISVYAAEAHFFEPDIVRLMQELAADVSFALDAFAEKARRKQAEDEIRRLNVDLEHRILARTGQLEAINKELEAFCYSVSHDLRAPLRSIDGFSQMLLKTCRDRLDATGQDWLERVRRASQHMGHLIDDLLHLSQVTRSPLRREIVSLSEIAEEIADDLRKTAPAREVRFTLEAGLSTHADPGLLRIAMNNLLGNAFKYTCKKTHAEIEFGRRTIGNEAVYFVRDNGAGFNMDYAHKLFGTFQRLHGAEEFDGTGIGLATVQRIIHRHNGKVWAKGIENEGATFYFTLPQRARERG